MLPAIRNLRDAAYELARAALYGAVVTSVWFAIESLFPTQPFPLPLYSVPIIGAAGGIAWNLLGRVPLRGRLWYYCRWIIISTTGFAVTSSWSSFGLTDVLITVGFGIASGIGIGYFAEGITTNGRDETP